MITMTAGEVAEVVGGSVAGDQAALVSGPASVDSRTVEPGGLFVAVVGEHVDGHDFAGAAGEAGATVVLGTRPTGLPTVLVEDPVAALGLLARHVVERLPETTVLALTGSQGKTGTKDYLAQVLATAGPTVATAGNLNNEIGVPLTVLRATEETRFLVVEMGARGIGHIRYLCDIARPTITAVLNVGTAHMSEFGSVEAIARAKAEIVEGLASVGTAVLNADDPLTTAMADRTAGRVLTFGEAEGADVRWRDVTYDDLGRPAAELVHDGVALRQSLAQVGAHQLANAGAAATMAVAAGLDFTDVVTALGTAVSRSAWRMEVHEVPGGPVVVNDAYNANPASMRAALDALAQIAERRDTRTIAVLGEMKELGESAPAEHAGVGGYAAAGGVDVLLVIGEPARPMVDGATAVTSWAGSALFMEGRDEALAWLRENVAADDVVLVKASRGAALETVAQGLVEGTTDA